MQKIDVIIIGAGGGGAVMAKELGELGLSVQVLEAGPWYGNRQWPKPNLEEGGKSSSSTGDLDIHLFKDHYNKLENTMNDLIRGRIRWGPANLDQPVWNRVFGQRGFAWQNSGVGGSTQHYLANSPRAFPLSIDHEWPLSYRELMPFYEKVESILPVEFAPTTSKEELFYFGARKAGWSLLPTLNVTSAGYRPQPNAILLPNSKLTDPAISSEQLSWMEGCTLAGHCINGCPHGPSVEKVAKRSTNVSYIPLALKTGNVEVRPNSFTYQILTEKYPKGGLRATGVKVRNTWTGETEELYADCVVMSAGAIETPRLWLNSHLPKNDWVGKGLTNHNMDMVTGVFDEKELLAILGNPSVNPYVGHTSAARFDYPGLGSLLIIGVSPGLMASFSYALGATGHRENPQINSQGIAVKKGRIAGKELIELMLDYQRSLNILIVTDDEVDSGNGVSVLQEIQDEHGPIPFVKHIPTKKTRKRKQELLKIATNILLKAGAKKVIQADWPDGVMIHITSTMRMGFVVDKNGEAYQVSRLFIADNSILTNGVGGVNPTITTQAIATRTAQMIYEKYF